MTAARATSNWALVTGASKGIGAATARALAATGRDVLVHYGRDADGAEKTAAACAEHGVQARTVAADLAAGIDPLAAAIDDAGGVGVLVNNAGVTADGLALSMSDEAFAAVLQVNLVAAFSLCRAALRGMLRARGGRVVNVTSVVGLHGNPGQANYAASKAGLVGLTKTLAREVGKRGITVNAVAPGFIDTAMTADLEGEGLLARVPAARLGTPEEVAAVVAFLASDAAAYVNGAVVQVDGGLFA
ncbi:MAG TPA: 3-oxoacyl-ACP reductase FabG [Egibacteraceae bacterium]|jgi:3-oxoacyl-[acyl-carrier protein] reductase|nr:3-oxoacyl-ACP reductase FabG [Egibacteraceae bacterium]